MSETFLLNSILGFFTTNSNRSYKRSFALLITFIVSLSLVLINLGFPPITTMPWDVILQLDGAWRVVNGQTPYVDFSPIIPPFTIILTSLVMKTVTLSASSISYGNIFLFIVLTFWAWFIAQRRLSATIAFMFAAFMGLLLVAPRALGYNPEDTSFAMIYNRQGWALLSMLLLESFVIPRKAVKSEEIAEGISTGALLALLLFGKLTFFGVGLLSILIRFVFYPFTKKWLASFLITFLCVFFLIQIFFHFNLSSYVSEMAFVGKVYGPAKKEAFLRIVEINMRYFKLMGVAIIPLLLMNKELNRSKQKNTIVYQGWLLIRVVFVIGSGILLCSLSNQFSDIPTFLIVGLIFLENLCLEAGFSVNTITSRLGKACACILLVIFPLLWAPTLFTDAKSIIFSLNWHRYHSSLPKSQIFQSRTLRDFLIPESSSVPLEGRADVYPREVNDGITLLRKHITDDSRIFAVAFANPFPFALEMPPAGGVSNWVFGLTFDYNHFPNADKVFKGVNMVMIPNERVGNNLETLIAMKEIYKDYLDNHFIKKDNSPFWDLYVSR